VRNPKERFPIVLVPHHAMLISEEHQDRYPNFL